MRAIVIICFVVAFAAVSFTTAETVMPDAIDLNETCWTYIDEEDTYEICFDPSGRLVTTHPRDVTPNNDFWRQHGDIMEFEYNDEYAWYRGVIYGGDSIIGTAHNIVDKSWDFRMYRYAEPDTSTVLQ